MNRLIDLVWMARIWHDRMAQDMIEYALMSGLIATGVVALSPQLAASISMQFSRAATPLSIAATQGS
jgi:Flp pilus assembly pilin Flp